VERYHGLARGVSNYREGFTFKNDTLSEVFYHNFKGGPLDGQGATINKKDFQKAVRLYAMNLWVGIRILESLPPAKLIELGLDWLNEVKR